MAGSPAYTRIKTDILSIIRAVPAGRVATFDAIGAHLDVPPRHVAYILAKLTELEREIVPWHRVVAKGGAIGHGPYRDQQFTRLMREGVVVSPAGVVHDMARVVMANFDTPLSGVSKRPEAAVTAKPTSRSRGMKDRPGH